MKIAISTETFPPDINGVAMTLYRLATELAKRGHEVEVIRPKPREDFSQNPPWKETFLPGIPIPRYPEAQMGLPIGHSLKKRWKASPPDILHVATEGPQGLGMIRLARKMSIPLISSFHTNFHQYCEHYGVKSLESLMLAYLRSIHNSALATLVPDPNLMRELKARGFNDVRYFGRGVDTGLFSPEKRDESLRQLWGVGPSDPVLIHVSRLGAEKNIPLILNLFARFHKQWPSSRLVLVGDGPARAELTRLANDLSIPVIFTGMLLGEELARHYASGDIFPFASETETFGNVIMEGLASGLAVLSYDYAAAKQFITDGSNGYSVSFGDTDAFTSRLEGILENFSQQSVVRTEARKTACEVPWSRVVDSYEESLLSSLSGMTQRKCHSN